MPDSPTSTSMTPNIQLNLAPTMFVTGPLDSLATVDVYTNAPATPINTTTSVLAGLEHGITDRLLKAAAGVVGKLPKDLNLLVHDFQSGNVVGGLNQLAKVVGDVRGGIQNLKTNVISGLLSAVGVAPTTARVIAGQLQRPGKINLKQLTMEAIPQARVIAGAINQIQKINDVDSADSYSKLIHALNGTATLAQVTNMDAKVAVAGAVSLGLTQQHMSGLIGALASPFQSTPALNDKFMLHVANNAAVNSDLPSLNIALGQAAGSDSILGLSSNGLLKDNNPNITHDILGNYSSQYNNLDPSGFPMTKADEANNLVSTLSLVDPNWNTKTRNGTQVQDLSVYQSCSPDALNLLQLHPDTAPAALIANTYPPTTHQALATANYPIASQLDWGGPSTLTAAQRDAFNNMVIE